MKEGIKFNLIMGAGCDFDDKDNLYVADRWNFAVRKVNLATGEVTDVIGQTGKGGKTMDGPAADARFHDSPGSVVIDPVNRCIWSSGVDDGLIRRLKNGWMKTLAGGNKGWWVGPAQGVEMHWAHIAAVDREGNAYEIEAPFMGVRRLRRAGKTSPVESE